MKKVQQIVGFGTLLAVLSALLATPGLSQTQEATCHDQWPAWSPDGESIVFTSTRTGDHEIFVLSLSNGHVMQLTDVPGRDAHPAFRPMAAGLPFRVPGVMATPTSM